MDDFIKALDPEIQRKVAAEGILWVDELREVPDAELKTLGLRLGDIARLRLTKRGRAGEDDDDDAEGRERRDARGRAARTDSLVASGILADPMKLARLAPKNWAGGVEDVVGGWRSLCTHAHPLTWEEIGFLARLVRLLEEGTDPRELVWSRLVVTLGKAKFPAAANQAEAAWEAKLVRATDGHSSTAAQVRLATEYLEKPWAPPPNPPPQQGPARGFRKPFQGKFQKNYNSNSNNPASTSPKT
jgi:hypothetical protein